MDIRQEQVVLIGTILVIGAFALTQDSVQVKGLPRSKSIELVPHIVPDATRVLPGAREAAFTRDILSEPTNARPMPMLSFVQPPLAPLPALAAPPVPGPSASSYGAFLRQDALVTTVPSLFDGSEILASANELGTSEDVGEDTLSALRQLGFVPEEEELLEQAPDRAALTASYKKLYDWILLDEYDYHFGHIDNRDRFRLSERQLEDVALTEVDPATGLARMVSMGSVDYQRARVTSFGFAATPTNLVELGAIDRESGMTRGNVSERLGFADWCVSQRHEAPRALAIAGDLFERVAAFDDHDPTPRLGLASCLEAGFEFEAAFEQYGILLERFPQSAPVAAAMASLEERFLMLEEAEARLRDAVRFDRASYVGQWSLGTFLLRHGHGPDEIAEAVAALIAADRFAPDATESAGLRSDIRVDLGAGHLAVNNLKAARRAFEGALGANPGNQKASAGVMICDRLEGIFSDGEPGTGEAALGADFLLARGLNRIESSDWVGARDDLLGAAVGAPLESQWALRALSRLAERTGNDGEAMEYVEAALLISPGDAWASFQMGRLLLARDDVAGAQLALTSALAADVDFIDALVLLGDIAMQGGEFASAERYFDRALRLEAPRADVNVRRGLNALYRGDAGAARERFASAREIDEDDPVAVAGLAWCEYLDGQSEEALNRLAGLDDSRRMHGDDDPWRQWAVEQKERIELHLDKSRWVDEFDRKSLRNDWLMDEGAGPIIGLKDEALSISGQFTTNGVERVFQAFSAVQFVSISADFFVSTDSAADAGLFIAREQGSKKTISAQVRVHRHKDGTLQTHVIRSGRPDEGAQDVNWLSFPAGEVVRLRIERSGTDTAATVNVFVGGTPILEDIPMSSIGKSASNLSVGFFVEGESGRRIDMTVDNVEIVRRTQ
jgi:tetratricopeptide (TPR) repeat protein